MRVIVNIFKVPELRKRILFTLAMLAIYRFREKQKAARQGQTRVRNELLDRLTFRPLRRRLRRAG